MRKLLTIFCIAMLGIAAISCETEPDQTQNGNQNGGETVTRTINFGEPTVTSTTIELGIVPTDTEANYFVGILAASELEGKDDAAIITDYVQKLEMRKGVGFIKAENLTPETEYTAIAFYMGDTTEKVTRLNVSTTAPGAVEEEFYVRITVSDITSNSAIVKATPNREDVKYFFRVFPQQEFIAFGILNNDREIFNYILESPFSNDYIVKGEKTLNCTDLAPNLDYIAIAFNADNYENVVAGAEPLQLVRKEFTTEDAPEVDPTTLFTYENLETSHTSFSLDVTPVKGDDKLWAYYVFEKQYYNEYLAKSRHQVVTRAYFGLYNLYQEYNILNHLELTFNEFINEYHGNFGKATIESYESLKHSTEYVVAIFYMDPEVDDPTVVYDYDYVAVNFETDVPDESMKATMDVQGPVIEKEDFGYTVSFNVAVDNNAAKLRYGAAAWNENVAKYYDPNDCESVRAFVNFTLASAEVLATAQTTDGATIEYNGLTEPFDGIFMFEAENTQGARTQYMVRVTPDMFN